MPSLITEQLNDPGTHVLVVGVSEYLHFDDGKEPTQQGELLLGMEQLSAAAHSAAEFAAWMLNEYENERAPLSSLRVLLSPSPNEVVHPDIEALLAGDFSATLNNVEAQLIQFRNACDRHTDNIAVVYVAGHGVQLTKTGSILLLHDCGANNHATLLKDAIDMAGVHAGFNHPNTAQTQFWFVDACRQEPAIASRFESMDGGLRLDEPDGVAETTAMFLAATTGTQAFARVGDVTLFNEALLWGLRGGFANAPENNFSEKWHVSTLELVKRLRLRVKALAEAENAKQTVDPTGRLNDALFHEYPQTPQVDLRVNLLPPAATLGSQGLLENGQEVIIAQNVNSWPMEERVDAGLYKIRIDTPEGYKNYSDFLSLNPPDENREIDVTL